MRVCLIGEYGSIPDEGMRNVTCHLANQLSHFHDVLRIDVREVSRCAFWMAIKRFNPDIVHYVHGPSAKSFVLMKLISLWHKNGKTVMSAMHPYFSSFWTRFIPLFKPDMLLAQSQETETKLRSLGCHVDFLPCGVDTNRFVPVSPMRKAELRNKYGVDTNVFVVLHVGSLKPGRGVQALTRLQTESTQVLVVAATSAGVDQKTLRCLEDSGCFVWVNHIPNIEEVYGLADCYVYPTKALVDKWGRSVADSIEMPLSVLEAMSCNLPVISTKFGALPRVFSEGRGLIFVDKEEDFPTALEQIRNRTIEVRTREDVLAYSWETVAFRLGALYQKLLENGSQ